MLPTRNRDYRHFRKKRITEPDRVQDCPEAPALYPAETETVCGLRKQRKGRLQSEIRAEALGKFVGFVCPYLPRFGNFLYSTR